MQELRNFIESKIHLDKEELDDICASFKHIVVPTDRHLLKKGQHVTAHYFMQKGAMRIYFENSEQETTACFAFENDFFTDLSSVKSGLPSQYNIQALEPCELYSVESTTLEQLYNRYPKMERFGRLVWEFAFTNVVNGIINFQTMTAKERYLMALKNPNLAQRVPLQHLASFLGITKTSLSRLRAELTND